MTPDYNEILGGLLYLRNMAHPGYMPDLSPAEESAYIAQARAWSADYALVQTGRFDAFNNALRQSCWKDIPTSALASREIGAGYLAGTEMSRFVYLLRKGDAKNG